MSLAGVARSVWVWAGLVTSACGVAGRGEGRVRWRAECRTGSGGVASDGGVCAGVGNLCFGSARGRTWGAERGADVWPATIACRRIAGLVVAAVVECEFCEGVPGRGRRDDGGARRPFRVMWVGA